MSDAQVAGPSGFERRVVAALRALLAGLADGAELPHDRGVLHPLFLPLEHYLSAVLRQVHPTFWQEESFDAFALASGRRTGPRSAELLGLALLITDQAWTPFQLHMRIAADADQVEWLHAWCGEPGSSGELLRVRWGAKAETERLLRDLPDRRDRIAWTFEAIVGE